MEASENRTKIFDLLRLIAFQIGKEVSIEELAKNLKGVTRNTIEYYLDLLSKVFVIYPLKAYSKNLRKEITKGSRWYFYDNGIRNAIIRNFNPLNLRNDKGDLWENYLASERIKFQSYSEATTHNYFWRTYDQQEIDWIEECNQEVIAFEFKWNTEKNVKIPTAWKKAYPDTSFQVIHPFNYLEWITN